MTTKHPGRDERDETDVDLEAINAMPLYAMYSVFATASPLPNDTATLAAAQQEVEATGVRVRGFYDVGGFRADADLMVWTLANDAESLQAAYHALRRSALGDYLEPVWSVVAVHRPAEFNRLHVPSCFAGFAPRPWLTVYPFVRSYDWYYLDNERRSKMLYEHGVAGREFPDVVAAHGQSLLQQSDVRFVRVREVIDAPVGRLADGDVDEGVGEHVERGVFHRQFG